MPQLRSWLKPLGLSDIVTMIARATGLLEVGPFDAFGFPPSRDFGPILRQPLAVQGQRYPWLSRRMAGALEEAGFSPRLGRCSASQRILPAGLVTCERGFIMLAGSLRRWVMVASLAPPESLMS
jgi:hypothetical protein